MFDQVCGVTYNILEMKNRVLLTMLIIFIVLAGIGITCGTIFVVRDVEIVDMTVQTAEALTQNEKDEIIKQTSLRGKNILFNLHQDDIAQKVKSVNSMLKLQKVTAKFPNRVVLTVVRRVPIFYDSANGLWFDSEMCVVEGTAPYRVNITAANLKLVDGLAVGDLAMGKDEWSQCKINQLKTVASYFPSLEGFEIAYNDDPAATGGSLVCLLLKIKPNVTFKIKVKPCENFLYALEYTDQIYRTVANMVDGEYLTCRDDEGVYTKVLDDNGKVMKDSEGKDMEYYE